jgi:hypothetical protein
MASRVGQGVDPKFMPQLDGSTPIRRKVKTAGSQIVAIKCILKKNSKCKTHILLRIKNTIFYCLFFTSLSLTHMWNETTCRNLYLSTQIQLTWIKIDPAPHNPEINSYNNSLKPHLWSLQPSNYSDLKFWWHQFNILFVADLVGSFLLLSPLLTRFHPQWPPYHPSIENTTLWCSICFTTSWPHI